VGRELQNFPCNKSTEKIVDQNEQPTKKVSFITYYFGPHSNKQSSVLITLSKQPQLEYLIFAIMIEKYPYKSAT
jgi:hypothetical protein